ncbi:hypothetical protein [Streptomyces sp. NPDC020951]|uniref:hypothetical protein n=1 Tax=Streptomyces sp. NPDC020951 TaxID=3365104 RepID=UPI0037AC8BA9
MKGSRVPALLIGLTAVLTLAACGVPPSDVIQAGPPASGMAAPRPKAPSVIRLYFLHDGDLTPYPREVDDRGDLGVVVRLLFGGPTASEARTATTELPRLTDAPDVAIGGDLTISVRLPEGVPPLSHPAMLQLACTVALTAEPVAAQPAAVDQGDGALAAPSGGDAETASAPTSVQVLGDGWTMTQSDAACPEKPPGPPGVSRAPAPSRPGGSRTPSPR